MYRPTWEPDPWVGNPSASERAVFGTAYREQEEKRFMSALHTVGMPNAETPGPGAYRTADNRLLKTEKSAKFGTAPQRPDVPKEALGKPGLCTTSLHAPTNVSERFPLEHMEGPDAAIAQPSLPLQADSTVSTALQTPGAMYDIPSMPPPSQVTVFPRGPAHYNPEKGGNSKGPYIGRLHEDAHKGIDSPGPGAYPAASCLQPAGGAKFGPATPSRTPKPNEVEVPGPGAHNPNFGAASVRPTAASFSMGANLRTDWAAFSPNTPGPAAYSLPNPDRASNNTSAPSYSMGAAPAGRLSHVARTSTPAPDAYGRPEDPRDRSALKKGFSFGVRERAKQEGTVISNRYHGPLHAQEGMCTESPGPGCYDNPPASGAVSTATGTRFGTSSRDAGSKIYISHMHAAAEGYGTASPGPGCYNVAETGGLGSGAKFTAKVAPKFGTSPRFSDKVCTK
ncbi:hypothetical protein VOLCADRAFT_91334 [Volvox carteri f. nagariensis]|uniref:Flagellar associated protein n=1 Tax=Volvox carteri f. nagariensis TaxID=3068 RepID=D8TWT0_VOLCA|nr:uncharacterized protein VOLCADRAFT_91334 [Volvox carteri f. nagariensis]EFJ48205.1 hypothetical protein VOLCADRAFT_91334 [Volvox carteri f. nagariensis]|eukprot:XP_002950890.1 hypothetical protein VOLCADRAFT_91334 [Volvox carteri f. nagariensis]